MSVEYELYVSYTLGDAWFGQYIAKDDNGAVYWNTNKLDKLYNKGYPTFLEKYKDPSTYNGDIFATGCGICSSAMIFRSMDATMSGYDLRTGIDGTLQADPYTALLSNCNLDGRGWSSETYLPFYGDSASDYPELFHSKYMGVSFGYSGIKDISITENDLRKVIADYGFVLIYLDPLPGKTNGHFMVLTGLEAYSSSTNKPFAQRAIVYDPAGMSYNTGAGIRLSETKSGFSGYTLSKISKAKCFVK